MYMPNKMGTLTIGTSKLDEGDRFEEDFTAIPDLAAGAIGELFNSMRSEFGKVPAIRTVGPRNISRKCDLITSWFFTPNRGHQKIACVVQQNATGRMQLGTVWEDGQTSDQSIIVPE
jgi:hypothetical protein